MKIRTEHHYRQMAEDNPSATWGYALAAHAVIAALHGRVDIESGEPDDVSECAAQKRRLRDTYGETLDGRQVIAEMDSARGAGKPITIQRTGNVPLEFRGALISSASSRLVSGQERNRWHEVALYRTAGGKVVGHIGYRTTWQGERDHDTAAVMESPGEVAEWLRTWIPASVVAGYPPHPSYAEKQARLLATVEADYQALIGEVLAAAGPEFAERVD